jgi:hypothetical protein
MSASPRLAGAKANKNRTRLRVEIRSTLMKTYIATTLLRSNFTDIADVVPAEASFCAMRGPTGSG